jgi:hypothetical protein
MQQQKYVLLEFSFKALEDITRLRNDQPQKKDII